MNEHVKVRISRSISNESNLSSVSSSADVSCTKISHSNTTRIRRFGAGDVPSTKMLHSNTARPRCFGARDISSTKMSHSKTARPRRFGSQKHSPLITISPTTMSTIRWKEKLDSHKLVSSLTTASTCVSFSKEYCTRSTPISTFPIVIRVPSASVSSASMSQMSSSPKPSASKFIRSTSLETNVSSTKIISGSCSETAFINSSRVRKLSRAGHSNNAETSVSATRVSPLKPSTDKASPCLCIPECTQSLSQDKTSPRLYIPECKQLLSTDVANVSPVNTSPLQFDTKRDLPVIYHRIMRSFSDESMSTSSARASNRCSSPQTKLSLFSTCSSSYESVNLSPARISPLSFDELSSSSWEGNDEELETVLTEVDKAASESKKSKSLMPLIKEELKTKIQLQRLRAGKEELEVEFAHTQFQMTFEELQKRERQREQNRKTALKSRNKQRQKEKEIEEHYQEVDSLRKKLQQEHAALRLEKRRLSHTILTHINHGCQASSKDEDFKHVIKLITAPAI